MACDFFLITHPSSTLASRLYSFIISSRLTFFLKAGILIHMEQMPLFASHSLSVTDLTRYLRQLLESDDVLRDVWVQGEISNISRPSSGHIYFTLKDEAAALKCVIWRTNALRLRLPLQNGMAIEAHGYISLYERDGAYQLYVDAARLAGEGMLYQEFMRLKARLEAEGLFDPERKRPLPARPQRIGIATSATGAALQDMLNTLRRRYPLAEVLLAPCAVQGDDAPLEIVAALGALNRSGVDVILLARGGGSLEDLWAFNDERVVRSVVESAAPVVTGVGHETDFTLSDFAADLRAPTPTGAAVLATPDKADLTVELNRTLRQLDSAFLEGVSLRYRALNETLGLLERNSPRWRVSNDRQRLDALGERLQRNMLHNLALRRVMTDSARSRLLALNPLAVLRRGFAVVSRAGEIVRSVAQLTPGTDVQVRLANGSFGARVETLSPDSPANFDPGE
ncbi:exodeoxyribonuclease VII large subunit [Longilinea arvoryzae]|uniref:Exodeoxyribonuclease 7 large subunit n=2 Tax=Longilinea arvoryzae TaxID=360412 RepID=A0A0S7BFM7_9CHLR|nr:exodeoxyribonuclease VII large subunit [Longilinea arvoryzae]